MGPRKAPVEVNWPFLCKTCTCAPLHLILFLPMASNADSRRPSRHRSRLRSTPAVTPQGVTPSSSARNVRRRTTRSSSSSGASNNHLVTPTPQGVTLSSIRDTARNPTRGTGQRSNDRYTREYSHYQSIVASQEGAPASPLRADTDDGVVFGPAVLLQAMFPLLLLLLLGQTLPCPRRDSVTVILKSQPALFVTLANIVHSMWACTAVAHVGGGFMRPALDGTLSPGLGVLPCSSRVHGIPTYACHCHLDHRTPGIVLSAGSSTSKLHGL
jgi:hypothetical protein